MKFTSIFFTASASNIRYLLQTGEKSLVIEPYCELMVVHWGFLHADEYSCYLCRFLHADVCR